MSRPVWKPVRRHEKSIATPDVSCLFTLAGAGASSWEEPLNTVGKGFENAVRLWRTLGRQAAKSYRSQRATRQKSQTAQLSRDGPNRIGDSSASSPSAAVPAARPIGGPCLGSDQKCCVPARSRYSVLGTFSWGWGLPTSGLLMQSTSKRRTSILRPTGVWQRGVLELIVFSLIHTTTRGGRRTIKRRTPSTAQT